ncbi:MAG: alpha-L-rhamnosidase C-terminal domain-containing protein [Bacteroidales bacterium]|nr:alpha-L-rhamnosidase C-terminal domain-containing protein [Bacteroidales bacterium]
MGHKSYIVKIILLLFLGNTIRASNSFWITSPDCTGKEFGVFYFSKEIDKKEKPESLLLHISADNRYILYVNGEELSRGPSRGDLNHWNYETVDIARALRKGTNRISVCVWNFGEYRPSGQISERTALWIDCNDSLFSTRTPWLVTQDKGYSPISIRSGEEVRGGYLSGASERVDYNLSTTDWKTLPLNNPLWRKAEIFCSQENAPWKLQKRPIPFLEQQVQSIGKIRSVKNAKKKFPITIAPHTEAEIIIDHQTLTIGHPQLVFSKGKNSTIRLTYAEAPFLPGQRDNNGKLIGEGQEKGDRDKIEEKKFVGNYDEIIANGREKQYYSPLWYRCFRYLHIHIQTQEEPLVLKSLKHLFSAYPFKENAYFNSGDKELSKIWDVSWRTARMCAHETYNDCPYYEQLQYIGDTRIQALVSLVVSGDERLMKQAIQQFAASMDKEGMLQAAYPSSGNNVIPPFSLYWIGMVYDYYKYRDDPFFIKEQIQYILPILEWYAQYIDSSKGLLGKMPGWHFVDWPDEWAWLKTRGLPAGVEEGESAILSLQYAMIADQAAEILNAFGYKEQSDRYTRFAKILKDGVQSSCFDEKRGCYANTPAKKEFSQHVNALAILCGLKEGKEAEHIAEYILQDRDIIKCTVYYNFYLHRALAKIGRSDLFLSNLKPWIDMLRLNLTTFAERQEPTRSDCHAWSASPMFEFLSGVCGIEPSAAGFKRIRIAPNTGYLNKIEASMPHPNGKIFFRYNCKGKRSKTTIILPENCYGEYITKQKEIISLKPGKNRINNNNFNPNQ